MKITELSLLTVYPFTLCYILYPVIQWLETLSCRLKCRGFKAPGLVDRVFAVHAGSQRFDSNRRHMSDQFFRFNRPGHPHPVCSNLENSGIRVAVGDCSVTERLRWRPPYQTGKTVHLHANTTNMTRTDARRRVCKAMVPYRRATPGTSLRELDYTWVQGPV